MTAARARSTLLGMLLALFACRLVLAMIVIPPWQHGDEPSHVASVLLAASDRPDQALPRLEREIIGSMATHGWWAYYRRPTPDPLPDRFLPIVSVESRATGSRYYDRAAGWLVGALAPGDVESQLHVLRGVSALLGLATVVFCWAAARAFDHLTALVTTAVLAWHPQFALVSTTATPDIVLVCCGAFAWWQSTRLITSGRTIVPLVAAWAAVGVATLTKVRGAVLVPVAAFVTVMAWEVARRRTTRAGILLAATGAGVVAIAAGAWLLVPEAWPRARLFVQDTLAVRAAARPTWAYVLGFSRGFFDSVWLVAGWFQYPGPRMALDMMHALTLVAAVGAAIAFVRATAPRRLLLIAGVFVAVHLLAVFVYHLVLMNGGALGRYLFPAIGPMTVLLWVGLRSWWPERYWPALAASLIALMVAFDLIGWAHVIVPAYAR